MAFDPKKLEALYKNEKPLPKFDPKKLEALYQPKQTPLIPTIGKAMASEALKTFRATQDIPSTAIRTGLSGIASISKRVKEQLPSAEEAAIRLGEKGIPSPLAALGGVGAAAGKVFLPETATEVGLMAVAPVELPQAVRRYASRVAPSLVEFLFPSVGKIGAEALAKSPSQVAKIAALGPEGAARAEVASVNKVRASVGKVIKQARDQFGKAKNKILTASENPSIDARPLQQTTAKTLVDYNFLPELKTAQVADPKLAGTLRSVASDVEEFATRPGKVVASELMRFRENINKILRSPVSDQIKGALGQIKESVDEGLQKSLGDELYGLYGKANSDFAGVARNYFEIQKLVSKTGAAKRIVGNVEDRSELGLKLIDFLKDASSLDDLSSVVGARRFAGDIFRNLRQGASAQGAISFAAGSPSLLPGAKFAGQMGLPVTPFGLAQFGSALSRLIPQTTGLAAALSVPTLGKIFNQTKLKKPSIFDGQ